MLEESLRRRASYRRHIEASGLQSAELLACRDDPVHWVNQWCYTYDPRAEVKSIPFDLFPSKSSSSVGWRIGSVSAKTAW